MSIGLLYYNILIPIYILEEKVAPLEYIIKWNRRWNAFHDDHLYHEGAMSQRDAEAIICLWEQHGLKATIIKDGKEKWNDLCCIDMFGQLMLPCDWIDHEFVDIKNSNEAIAWLKNKPKGEIIWSTIKKIAG